MEYRKLPHGKYGKRFSALGLGMGGIQKSSDKEIEKTICMAKAEMRRLRLHRFGDGSSQR